MNVSVKAMRAVASAEESLDGVRMCFAQINAKNVQPRVLQALVEKFDQLESAVSDIRAEVTDLCLDETKRRPREIAKKQEETYVDAVKKLKEKK